MMLKKLQKDMIVVLQIKGYNDIKEGDVIEAYQEVEAVKKKLK